MHAILSAKAVWAAAKDAAVAEKVWTASMMARKSLGYIGINNMGGAKVLGPTESERTGGTRGAEEAGDSSSGTVTDGAMETRIYGSSLGTVGGDWSFTR